MTQKLILVIFVFLALAFSAFGQEFTQVADGIEYAKFTRKIKDEPVNVNLLKLDLTKVRLDIVHALDAAIGLETTSSIASRHGAIAAINAGFFKLDGLYNGDSAGVLKIDGKVLSETFGDRIALGIFNGVSKTEVDFAHLKSENYIFARTDPPTPILGINRRRKHVDTILYTPELHRTTLTSGEGTEYVIKNGVITQVRKKKGSSMIPSDGFVLSIIGHKEQSFSLNDKVKLVTNLNPIQTDRQQFFRKTEDIVGGVPQLIKNGKIEITWEQEKIGKSFVEMRHPRTAVAKLNDGKLLMVTVDGRQPNVSVGMNLFELAEMLLELGAVEAMNLDGGGSTTMFLKDRVVNQPSDKTGERSVSDAILVFPRKNTEQ